jgi:hypothetical protein
MKGLSILIFIVTYFVTEDNVTSSWYHGITVGFVMFGNVNMPVKKKKTCNWFQNWPQLSTCGRLVYIDSHCK